MFNKKAEMGVGTLIIFIAMLLVAAVAAGVLIQTAGSLQEKSLSTGTQARSQISTHAETIEVSATDGRNGNLTDFQEIMKLSPGSDAIKLEQVILTFNTKDNGATLKYRGTGSICEKNIINGYDTLNTEINDQVVLNSSYYALEEDLDDDGLVDYLILNNTASLDLIFNISSQGQIVIDTTADITDASTTPVNVGLTDSPLSNGSTVYAYVSVGTTGTNDTLDINTLTVTPYKAGEGYFSVIYEQQGTNWINGNLQRGDVVRVCFEAPREITEDEELRINFIPKIGTSTLTEFVSPDVISTERVYLYP